MRSVDVAGSVITLREAGEDPDRVCTDDLRPRSLAMALDRDRLPDGFLTVHLPGSDGQPHHVSIPGSVVPRPEAVIPTGPTDGIGFIALPAGTSVGSTVQLQLINPTATATATTAPTITVDRWTGHHLEPAGVLTHSGDPVTASPGETVTFMVLTTTEPAFAEGPAIYRLTATVDVTTGQGLQLAAHAYLYLAEPEPVAPPQEADTTD